MIEPRKTIENISPYKADEYQIDWRLKLDSNENIYGASSNVLSAIKNIDLSSISLYPTYGKTLDKLSQKYDIKKENILLTNGCDEAINVILNTYLNPQDEILSYYPTFVMPQIYGEILGASIKLIDYDEKFIFDYKKIESNISNKTKIVYIATPNNPTGEIVKASIIEILLQKFPNILFIIDCTYINFSYNATFMDYIDLVKKYNNIAIIKSFSKDFALAGLRFGLVLADFKIINNLKKVIPPYSVNTISLNCAISALNDEKRIEEIKEQNSLARKALFETLNEKGFKPYESEGNFIFCDFNSYSKFYYEKFKKSGIIVRDFPKSSNYSNFLRITVPKLGGVKYISELLNKKDVLIFNLDGIIVDSTESYLKTIIKTVEHFTDREISLKEVLNAKNLGKMSCNWETVKYLLSTYDKDIELSEIITVFQNILTKYIDNEKLLISKETFEELSKDYDMVIFSGRLMDEVKYTLEKFDIDKYFHFYITSDDLPRNMLKPNPKGVYEILKHCPHKTITHLGSSVDDIIAANSANINVIGIIPPFTNENIMINNYRHLGVSHILNDVKNINSFLRDIKKERINL